MSEEYENSAAESHERDESGRFVVSEQPEPAPEPERVPEPAPEPQSEPEAAPAPEPEPEERPTPTSVAKPSKKKSAPTSSVTSDLDGEVVLKALVFEAPMRNSASVLLVQERLAELGHGAVRRDRPGWISQGTVEALKCFQGETGLDETGEADRETVEALMKGTKVKISD